MNATHRAIQIVAKSGRTYFRGKSGNRGSHQYTTLRFGEARKERSLQWTSRHRQICQRCLQEQWSTPPLDWDDWYMQAVLLVGEAEQHLAAMHTATSREEQARLLLAADTTLRQVPRSPDHGELAEFLGRATDLLHDAAYALDYEDDDVVIPMMEDARKLFAHVFTQRTISPLTEVEKQTV